MYYWIVFWAIAGALVVGIGAGLLQYTLMLTAV
jgi:hypothetical protein